MENRRALSQIGTLIAVLCLAVPAASVSWYFAVALPAHNREVAELSRLKLGLEGEAQSSVRARDEKAASDRLAARIAADQADVTRQGNLEACVNRADYAYWQYLRLNGVVHPGGTLSAPGYIWDAAARTRKAAVEECQVLYGRKGGGGG